MKLKGIELKGIYMVKFVDEDDGDGFKVYDEKGNFIYAEDNDGDWEKREFDEKGNRIYYESSDGLIIDERVKELTVEEIEKLLGYKIRIKGESK